MTRANRRNTRGDPAGGRKSMKRKAGEEKKGKRKTKKSKMSRGANGKQKRGTYDDREYKYSKVVYVGLNKSKVIVIVWSEEHGFWNVDYDEFPAENLQDYFYLRSADPSFKIGQPLNYAVYRSKGFWPKECRIVQAEGNDNAEAKQPTDSTLLDENYSDTASNYSDTASPAEAISPSQHRGVSDLERAVQGPVESAVARVHSWTDTLGEAKEGEGVENNHAVLPIGRSGEEEDEMEGSDSEHDQISNGRHCMEIYGDDDAQSTVFPLDDEEKDFDGSDGGSAVMRLPAHSTSPSHQSDMHSVIQVPVESSAARVHSWTATPVEIKEGEGVEEKADSSMEDDNDEEEESDEDGIDYGDEFDEEEEGDSDEEGESYKHKNSGGSFVDITYMTEEEQMIRACQLSGAQTQAQSFNEMDASEQRPNEEGNPEESVMDQQKGGGSVPQVPQVPVSLESVSATLAFLLNVTDRAEPGVFSERAEDFLSTIRPILQGLNAETLREIVSTGNSLLTGGSLNEVPVESRRTTPAVLPRSSGSSSLLLSPSSSQNIASSNPSAVLDEGQIAKATSAAVPSRHAEKRRRSHSPAHLAPSSVPSRPIASVPASAPIPINEDDDAEIQKLILESIQGKKRSVVGNGAPAQLPPIIAGKMPRNAIPQCIIDLLANHVKHQFVSTEQVRKERNKEALIITNRVPKQRSHYTHNKPLPVLPPSLLAPNATSLEIPSSTLTSSSVSSSSSSRSWGRASADYDEDSKEGKKAKEEWERKEARMKRQFEEYLAAMPTRQNDASGTAPYDSNSHQEPSNGVQGAHDDKIDSRRSHSLLHGVPQSSQGDVPHTPFSIDDSSSESQPTESADTAESGHPSSALPLESPSDLAETTNSPSMSSRTIPNRRDNWTQVLELSKPKSQTYLPMRKEEKGDEDKMEEEENGKSTSEVSPKAPTNSLPPLHAIASTASEAAHEDETDRVQSVQSRVLPSNGALTREGESHDDSMEDSVADPEQDKGGVDENSDSPANKIDPLEFVPITSSTRFRVMQDVSDHDNEEENSGEVIDLGVIEAQEDAVSGVQLAGDHRRSPPIANASVSSSAVSSISTPDVVNENEVPPAMKPIPRQRPSKRAHRALTANTSMNNLDEMADIEGDDGRSDQRGNKKRRCDGDSDGEEEAPEAHQDSIPTEKDKSSQSSAHSSNVETAECGTVAKSRSGRVLKAVRKMGTADEKEIVKMIDQTDTLIIIWRELLERLKKDRKQKYCCSLKRIAKSNHKLFELRTSPFGGKGIFLKESVSVGAVITYYDGLFGTLKELESTNPNPSHFMMVGEVGYDGHPEIVEKIRGTKLIGLASMANHSRTGYNCVMKSVRGCARCNSVVLVLVANKEMEKGTECLWDYNKKYKDIECASCKARRARAEMKNLSFEPCNICIQFLFLDDPEVPAGQD